MDKNTLESRMKEYEGAYKHLLTRKTYIIIRLDGKNFSKYTKKLNKPFDSDFSNAMDETAKALCKEFNAKFAYTQSDEISLVITDIGNINTQPLYGNNLQKLCSISASVATAKFNEVRNMQYIMDLDKEMLIGSVDNDFVLDLPKQAHFDARVFIVPNEVEVMNHMIWRQKDATRNSISMAAHELLGHKAIDNKSGSEKQDLMMEKGVNWNDYPSKFKRGVVIRKFEVEIPITTGEALNTIEPDATVIRNRLMIDFETPIFTEEIEYLRNLISTNL